VWTSIVHRVNLPVVVDYRNRVPTAGYHPASRRLQLCYGAGHYLPCETGGHNVALPVLLKDTRGLGQISSPILVAVFDPMQAKRRAFPGLTYMDGLSTVVPAKAGIQ
jgi:hypothetical protein